MIPKLAAAFVVGGLAVGSIFWFARPTPEPAPVAVAVAPTVAREVDAPQPAVSVPEPVPVSAPAREPKARPKLKSVAVAKSVPAKPPVAAPASLPARLPERLPAAVPETTPTPAPAAVVKSAEPAPPAILQPSRERPSADTTPATPRKPQTVTIPAGTIITVRLRDTLRASSNSTDDAFQATLDQPIVVDGFVLAERGTMQRGRIVESLPAGRVKGRAALGLELTQLVTSDGQKLDISTETFRKEAESSVKGDAAKAGVMAGIGAAVGAIAGGGKGAAIGAGVGGAAGAGTVLATKGKDAEIPSETRLTFRLKEPVTVTEKLN